MLVTGNKDIGSVKARRVSVMWIQVDQDECVQKKSSWIRWRAVRYK